MKKKHILFFLLLMFVLHNKVSALTCNYSISGYIDDDIYWVVDSNESKPAENVKKLHNLKSAGRESVVNWSSDSIGNYKAEDDINNGVCPSYLIQTYSSSGFDGYHVFLSDSDSLTSFINSDDVQSFGLSWDRSVVIFKYANREKKRERGLACGYIKDDYKFQLVYDKSGKLIGYDSVDEGLFNAGFLLSYTAYDETLDANTCNRYAYLCADFEVGSRRIYLNSWGLLNEDKSFNADVCTVYEYDENSSKSETGEPIAVSTSCRIYKENIEKLEKFGQDYKSCSGGDACGNLLKEFHQAETVLNTFCKSSYNVSLYNDTCVQSCLKFESDMIKIKKKYGIEIEDSRTTECGLSERIADWIIKIVSWVRYIIPVLLIILSILDFMKAIAADSEEDIKKAVSRFIKRLIVSVVIFLLPLLLEFILGIFGVDAKGFCL